VSCDSMPGGTAAPICLTVTQGTVCALDCSAGQTCPGGMICAAVEGMSVCV
jgi:hypothetical protein